MMQRLAMFCLAFFTGTVAFAQAATEWRPNVAEDNKAATWEDTAAFLTTVLATESKKYGLLVSDVEAGDRCKLTFTEKWWDRDQIDQSNGDAKKDWQTFVVHSARVSFDFKELDPLSISVTHDAEYQLVQLRGTDNQTFAAVSMSTYTTKRLFFTGAWKTGFSRPDPDLASMYSVPCASNVESASCADSKSAEYKWSLWFPDQDYSKRVARALMHASLLCGGTKAVSPF